MSNKISRLRRSLKTRLRIKELRKTRLQVHRTPQHIYAQVIDESGNVIASSSTLDKALQDKIQKLNKVEKANLVGKAVAEQAKAAGLTSVAFDRSGFKYHGRVKALADGAREGGLEF